MDLTSPLLNALKISSKKGYILVDPDVAEDALVVILSDGSTSTIEQASDNLVIYGPGDFETNGILIKGTRNDNETMYGIDTGEGRVLVVASSSISKLADEDDYDVVAVKAVTPVDDATLAAITPKLVVVYGAEEHISDALKAKKVAKVSLKKREEIEGNVVYLERK